MTPAMLVLVPMLVMTPSQVSPVASQMEYKRDGLICTEVPEGIRVLEENSLPWDTPRIERPASPSPTGRLRPSTIADMNESRKRGVRPCRLTLKPGETLAAALTG